MGIEKVAAGKQVPDDINVIIEIPSLSSPVKYEMDKESGVIRVDRFLSTPMFYPCEYGYIPQTLSEDGDPVDVLVISPIPLVHGCIIGARPIGLLRMTDESGIDAKILAVPVNKLTPIYRNIHKPQDLDELLLAKIEHFFKHYKDNEEGKWSKIGGWEDSAAAHKEIVDSLKRFQKQKTNA